jgi:hypothetical protein
MEKKLRNFQGAHAVARRATAREKRPGLLNRPLPQQCSGDCVRKAFGVTKSSLVVADDRPLRSNVFAETSKLDTIHWTMKCFEAEQKVPLPLARPYICDCRIYKDVSCGNFW